MREKKQQKNVNQKESAKDRKETLLQRQQMTGNQEQLLHQVIPGNILFLQGAIGNQGVKELIENTNPGQTIQKKNNTTGLSDQLKEGIEEISGLSMDDVKVHRHSSKPEDVGAAAYTQGTDIYIGPGQEEHLPHEAWHVVQQKQGRVHPTGKIEGIPLNDSRVLESEADIMGQRAMQVNTEKNLSREIVQGTSHTVQMKKTEQERATKHKRMEIAKKAINLLKNNVKDILIDHIFDAKPSDGSPVDKDDPVGLHAYTTTSGALPEGISQVTVVGNTGRVHGLEWKYNEKEATKRSSMFPKWMPKDHICTLIAIKYNNNESIVKNTIDFLEAGITPEQVKTHILQGQEIEIGKKGNTIYPVHGGLSDWLKE
jgi:hypothetical protein